MGIRGGGFTAIPVEHAEFARTVIEALKRSPIHAAPAGGRGGDLYIGEIEPWPGSRDLVSHLVTYTVGERGVERRAGLVIAPEDATVTAAMIRKAALDTAYDGTSFFARRIHFPGAGDDRQLKRLRAQLGRSLDTIRWNAALSVRSAPFEKPPEARVAVKIITTTGTEMSLVADVPSPEADRR